MIELYFFGSVLLTFLSTLVLDSYMNRGEILDFIRLAAAQWLAKRNGIEFDLEKRKDFNNYESLQYFERMQAYQIKYWEIAFKTKLMNPFICQSCMSVYIGFFYTVIFAVFFSLGFTETILWFFIQNLIVFFLIDKNSNNE